MSNKFKLYRYTALLVIVVLIVLVILEKMGAIDLKIFSNDLYKSLAVIVSFFLLPLIGFPFSVLLVTLGIRFNYIISLGAMLMIIPTHLIFSFWVVDRYFRDKIKYSPTASKFRIFNMPPEKQLEYAFIFFAVPVVPYAVKNYLLPASGIPFKYYFILGWVIQSILGAPFVILGEAASSLDYPVLLSLLILFAVLYIIMRKIKNRYYKVISKKQN